MRKDTTGQVVVVVAAVVVVVVGGGMAAAGPVGASSEMSPAGRLQLRGPAEACIATVAGAETAFAALFQYQSELERREKKGRTRMVQYRYSSLYSTTR